MHLSKNKNGQIGRHIPGTSFGANVDQAQPGEHSGNVYLSPRQVEEDQAYYNSKDREDRAFTEAKRARREREANLQEMKMQARSAQIEKYQALAKIDPMNAKLKAHFMKRAMMGETSQVADSLLRDPADFSSSGGNPEIVPSDSGKRPIVWHSDYRQHLIVGNPLTRNGVYGPNITDYDRYVNGEDVNQTDIVKIAGGTMLGRYNGSIAPNGVNGMGSLGESQVQADRVELASEIVAGQVGLATQAAEQQAVQAAQKAQLIKYGMMGLGLILLMKVLK